MHLMAPRDGEERGTVDATSVTHQLVERTVSVDEPIVHELKVVGLAFARLLKDEFR